MDFDKICYWGIGAESFQANLILACTGSSSVLYVKLKLKLNFRLK